MKAAIQAQLAGGRRRRDADRQALRPARRLLGGGDLGDRRQRDDGHGGERRAGGAGRPQPRLQQGAGGERRHPAPARAGKGGSPAASGRQLLGAGSRPLAGTAPRHRQPSPERTGGEEEPAEAPAETEAEAGPVKHVFVISLTSPGYEQSPGGASRRCPTSPRPCARRANCSATTRCSAKAPCPTASPRSAASRPTRDHRWLPDLRRVQLGSKASSNGVLAGAGCVYPVETLTLADQLTLEQLNWRAYADGMADPAGKPANCVYPGPGEARRAGQPGGYAASQNPFVYFHSLLDLGDCSDQRRPARPAEQGPAQSREDAQLLVHRADALQRGRGRPVPGRRDRRGRRAPTPSSRPGCRRSSPRPPTRRTAL